MREPPWNTAISKHQPPLSVSHIQLLPDERFPFIKPLYGIHARFWCHVLVAQDFIKGKRSSDALNVL
jgi:hypothetical protein